MIAGGIIMIIFGVCSLITGIVFETSELIRVASFFTVGSSHPGVLFIVLGSLLLIGGIILLVCGIKRDKENKEKQMKILMGGGSGMGGSGMGGPMPAGYPAPPPNPGAYPGEFRVQGVTGAFSGKRFRVEGHTVLGRDVTRCKLVFPEHCNKVSRVHCELWVEGGCVMLKDLGSSHGTFLENGVKLQPNVAVQLRTGDRFWLGDRSQTLVIAPKGGL